MAVPFHELTGDAGILDHGPHEPGHTPGQRRAGIRHAVAHGVAQPDLDINAAFLPELHELDGERHTKAIDIRPGNIFHVAPGHDPQLQGRLDDGQVVLQGLSAVPLQFHEDMVIGYRGENAGLPQAHFLDQLQVVGVGPDPAGDFRVTVPPLPAALQRFLVLGAV